MAAPKYSESTLNGNDKEKIVSDKSVAYTSNARADAKPDIVENILLDIQPVKILKRDKELEDSKDFYDDFGNERYNFSEIYICHI